MSLKHKRKRKEQEKKVKGIVKSAALFQATLKIEVQWTWVELSFYSVAKLSELDSLGFLINSSSTWTTPLLMRQLGWNQHLCCLQLRVSPAMQQVKLEYQILDQFLKKIIT